MLRELYSVTMIRRTPYLKKVTFEIFTPYGMIRSVPSPTVGKIRKIPVSNLKLIFPSKSLQYN
jgi:hypothetical protein